VAHAVAFCPGKVLEELARWPVQVRHPLHIPNWRHWSPGYSPPGPSRSANSAKELGTADVPTTRGFLVESWATDMGVHCTLDAMSAREERTVPHW
jgi:hypothetical protein